MSRGKEQNSSEESAEFANSHYSLKPGHWLRGQAAKTERILEGRFPEDAFYVMPPDLKSPAIQEHQDNRRKMLRNPRSGK